MSAQKCSESYSSLKCTEWGRSPQIWPLVEAYRTALFKEISWHACLRHSGNTWALRLVIVYSWHWPELHLGLQECYSAGHWSRSNNTRGRGGLFSNHRNSELHRRYGLHSQACVLQKFRKWTAFLLYHGCLGCILVSCLLSLSFSACYALTGFCATWQNKNETSFKRKDLYTFQPSLGRNWEMVANGNTSMLRDFLECIHFDVK